MSGYQPDLRSARDVELRARNRRTGLIFASIALVFFVGVLLKYTLLR
jgi:hypothetical protein